MMKPENSIPLGNLTQDAAQIIKHLKDSKKPIFITQSGQAAAVMLSVEAYEKWEHDKALLRLLVKGEKEIQSGAGHDLDEVLAEAKKIISDNPLPDPPMPLP
mgnify:CR=1 FL=1